MSDKRNNKKRRLRMSLGINYLKNQGKKTANKIPFSGIVETENIVNTKIRLVKTQSTSLSCNNEAKRMLNLKDADSNHCAKPRKVIKLKQEDRVEKQRKKQVLAEDIVQQIYHTCGILDCNICLLHTFIDDTWMHLLKEEFIKSYFLSIKSNLHLSKDFCPPINQIFNFTKFTSFQQIKVVIIGQDPYHNVGQAMGLSFSVNKGIKIPPSLRNIYSELKTDIPGFVAPTHGDLTEWANQGVLLLNDTLTVEKNQPASHSKFGWKLLTTRILNLIENNLNNVVFLLWGKHAQSKLNTITSANHLILRCGHPSPFSVRHFKGCKHFSKTNEYLVANGKEPINWNLTE